MLAPWKKSDDQPRQHIKKQRDDFANKGPSSQFSSVQFSRSVVSNSLRPYELQHTRPPCPSPTSGVYTNSCSLSWWCHPPISSYTNSCPLSQWFHPAISSSAASSSSCPQSCPTSGSFPVSWLFASGGQSIRASVPASILPKNIQNWFPSGLISLLSKGLLRVFSTTTVWKHQFFGAQSSL